MGVIYDVNGAPQSAAYTADGRLLTLVYGADGHAIPLGQPDVPVVGRVTPSAGYEGCPIFAITLEPPEGVTLPAGRYSLRWESAGGIPLNGRREVCGIDLP